MTYREIKRSLNRLVRFTNSKLFSEGAEYIFSGAVFRKDEKTGEFYCQAELTDRKVSHSVIYCKPEEIEAKDDD